MADLGLQPFQSVEIAGVVTNVTFGKGQPNRYRVHCPNSNRTVNLVYETQFCPVRQSDTIHALCMVGRDGSLHISKPPFVQPAMDRDSVVQCFMRALKQGYGPTMKIYQSVSRFAGGDENVIAFLSGIAQMWNDNHNGELLFMFDPIDSDDIRKLLGWWHRERNLRRLYLFGLSKKEINACRLTCDALYQKCMDNPYTVPAIPIEKCDAIMDRLNKKPDDNQRMCGAIVRVIWDNLHLRGWTGTPTKHLSRQFPGIGQYVERLKADYGLVAEMETAYLKFPHEVETTVAAYIAEKVCTDPIKYDTPIDEKITLEDGRVIERISAHYTMEPSEDQMKAIQGALDHNLCIITGGAGTGKCLALGTPVLMYDGSTKKIELIQEGEQVMGPDSRPRTVLSTCTGTDEMYRITSQIGESWECNEPHVLTLKKAKTGKIIDVPLNEYLEWPENVRNSYLLFHVGVEFPEQPLPVDPYLVGVSLYAEMYDMGINECITNTCQRKINPILAEYIKEEGGSAKFTHLKQQSKIPPEFLQNSRCNRLQLLAGYLDNGAGRVIHNDWLELDSLSSDIRTGLYYLVRSLGYHVTNSSIRPWCLEIRGNLKEIPTRRADICDQLRSMPGIRPEYKFTVEPLGSGQYSGFELDGDGRFLLGNFMVTHNTSCLGQVIHNLELRGINYAVCSFTGKAVARIREVTKKRNPATMHRLIANSKRDKLDKRPTQFEKEIIPGDPEHVIIDETSMVTTELFYDFIQAYPNVQRITFIGDSNQLPPIGWGSLFSEMVKSQTIPTYRLTTNYRVYTSEGERDGVILNANALINHDPQFPFEYSITNNFSLFEGPVERVHDIIKACYDSGLKSNQVIILSPYNRMLPALNKVFQQIYNDGARSVTDSRGLKWMVGDRVMLLENDKDIGVYNGESGVIRDISETALLIDFGQAGCHEFLIEPKRDRENYAQGQTDTYLNRGQLADQVYDGDEGEYDNERTVLKLAHAYAITVDKSQGSEYDFVIFYIPEFNTGSFVNRNRIYTALTRTKRCCWTIVSDVDALEAASAKQLPYRCENLGRRLKDALPELAPFRLPPPNQNLEMDNNFMDVPPDWDFGFDPDDFE